jgi:hypothetical protein
MLFQMEGDLTWSRQPDFNEKLLTRTERRTKGYVKLTPDETPFFDVFTRPNLHHRMGDSDSCDDLGQLTEQFKAAGGVYNPKKAPLVAALSSDGKVVLYSGFRRMQVIYTFGSTVHLVPVIFIPLIEDPVAQLITCLAECESEAKTYRPLNVLNALAVFDRYVNTIVIFVASALNYVSWQSRSHSQFERRTDYGFLHRTFSAHAWEIQ